MNKKEFIKLPMDIRRQILAEQASDPEIIAYYGGISIRVLTKEEAEKEDNLALRENGMVLSRERAAQAWCQPKTSHITMIPE